MSLSTVHYACGSCGRKTSTDVTWRLESDGRPVCPKCDQIMDPLPVARFSVSRPKPIKQIESLPGQRELFGDTT